MVKRQLELLFTKPPGNPCARNQGDDEDARYQTRLDLTVETVMTRLSSYLPTSARSRDRKAVVDAISSFVQRVRLLTRQQQEAIERRLQNMEPADGRRLESAHTRVDSIKIALDRLLEEAEKENQ